MADTFTFEDAQKAGADSFTFEEATGKDASGNTVANLAKSIARPVNTFGGDVLRALATQPMSMQQGIGIPDPQKLANLATGNFVNTPTYKAGDFIAETGQQMDTGKPTFAKKVAEMGGGFLPMVASGPFAPLSIGLQSFGGALDERLKKAKAEGKSDAEAAHEAIGVGLANGLTQAAIWYVLPKPFQSLIGKITGKVGANGISQFMARRAAGAVEGATLGATSTATQNLVTGQPVGRDVGASALGLGAVQALLPRGGTYPEPANVAPPAERPVAGLLGRGTRFESTPNGKVIDVTQISPFEQAELAREAEAESRQGGSGVERVVNTIDAALRKADEKVKTTVRANGNDWYKRGSFWVTDSPLVSMDKSSIKAGRGNSVEDAMVQDLETKLQAKETAQQPGKTQTQQSIEDVTGASAEQAKKGSAGRTALATREIIENKLWKRFASPLSEYGDKGQMTQRQQQKLAGLSDYLAKEPDVDMIERHWQQIKDVQPKYPYDIEYKRLIAERLGHELPEQEGGEKNAIGEIGNEGSAPPEHPGDVEGGAPVRTGGGGGPKQPAPVQAGAEKTPVTPGGGESTLTPEQQARSRQNNSQAAFAATQSGFTFREMPQSTSQEGLTAEQKSAMAEIDRQHGWEFTDKRPGSPTEGLTVNVPVGSKYADIIKAISDKSEADKAAKASSQPAAQPAPAPQPATPVTEPVGDQTGHWPDVLKELVLDAPPTGALTEEKFTKPGQPTRQAVIDQINRKIRLGADLDEIIKLIQKSRTPSGVLGSLGRIDVDPVLQAREVEAERRKNMTPEERAAFEKKEAEDKARADANPPTDSEKEYARWLDAWQRHQFIIRRRGESVDRNTGQPYTQTDLDKMDSDDLRYQKIIAEMKDKYGTPDPTKYRRQQSGEPPFKPPTAKSTSGFKEGDAVAMRDENGKIHRGIVIQTGGDLWVKTPDDRIARLSEGDWKPGNSIPLEPSDATEYTPEKFAQNLEKASGVKGKKTLDEIHTALDKVEPGFMDRVRSVIQKIRNIETQNSRDPEQETNSRWGNSGRVLNAVAEAAKAKIFADREFKGKTQSHFQTVFNRAKSVLAEVEKWANDVLKGGGVHLAPEVLAAYVVKGASVLARGIHDFAKWSDEMVGEFGEKARPYLQHVYNKSMAKLNEGNLAKDNPITRFAQQDVAPFLGKQWDAAKATINFFVNTFSPTSKARPGDVDSLFEAKGYKEKVMTRAAAAFEKAVDVMGKMAREGQIDFIDRIKKGIKQSTPELQQIADLLRYWDNKLYELAKVYKPALKYLDDHYRVLWEVIPGTQGLEGTRLEQIMSKRPWQGSKGFLLQHTLEDMSDGIHRGGVPVTYNPVEMFLLHAQDVMKFVSANRAFENLKKSGAAEFVERGADAPEGFTRINDRIAKKYFRTDESGPGEWWIQKDAARMIDNYLSQDWIRQGPFGSIGRALIGLKNLSTMVELGASPFHAVFETNEAVGSSIGLSVTKMLTPGFRAEGAREFAKAIPGTLPVVGGLIPKTASVDVLKLGGQIEKYAKNPEQFKARFPEQYAALSKQYPDLDHMVNDLFSGGGKVGMDEAYKTQWIKGLRDAMANNNYVGAVARALPMLNEQMLSPIFNIYIPRLKLGTFMREYSFELARRQDEINSGKITREQLARETWAFVDDRFGELNWDNLYWNRTFKSAMQLAFRSVTWKLGNTRGFGKAARDFGMFFGESAKFLAGKGGNPRLTQPLAWVMGMAIVTTIQSTILSKVFTGKYPWELAENAIDLMKNLTFPRIDKNDASQRISVPTYWKDLVHLAHSPTDYITSSMSGEIGRVNDIFRNKDFYGTKVYNEDDPFYKRVKDEMQHLIPVPFSYSSYTAAKKSGGEGLQSYTGFMGYTKAPYYISHSHAEQLAAKLLRDQLPVGGRTAEQAEKALKEHQAVLAIRRGEMTYKEAEEKGLINWHQRSLIEKQVAGNHVAYQLRTMTPQDAIRVWRVATPEEKSVIRHVIKQKIYNSHTLNDGEHDAERRQLLDELNK